MQMTIIIKIFLTVIFFTVLTKTNVSALNINHLFFQNINTNSSPIPIITNNHPVITKEISAGTKFANVFTNSNNNTKKREEPAKKKNKIVEIIEDNNGILNIVAEIEDAKSEIKITIFNMLGKEVRKVFQGIPTEKNDDRQYVFTSKNPLNLPKNVYILVIQGDTFRIAEKFIAIKN